MTRTQVTSELVSFVSDGAELRGELCFPPAAAAAHFERHA
jgi:hypothetical protein